MNQTILSNAGYVLALTACFVGAYLWKRAKLLATQVEDLQKTIGAEKEKLAQKNASLESILISKEKELEQKNRELVAFGTLREALMKESSDERKQIQDSLRSLENQLDHYKTQSEALLSQILELDAENAALKKTQEQDLREKTSDLAKTVELSQDENKKLHASTSKFESQVHQLQTQLTLLQTETNENVELMNRLKRKAYQSDHLYKTIRGQKEMLEERLENWEKALRLLSLWILRDKETTMSSTASLGEIVSAALQCSQQGPLMCDDVEIHVPVEAAVGESASV